MKKKSIGSQSLLHPAPATLLNLRRHFKEVYGFNPSQTEIMLESSSTSLIQAFGNVSEALSKDNCEKQLGQFFHGLKGLLLNMGENEWAAYTQDVERDLNGDVPCDLHRIVKDMQVGLADILFYSRDKGKKNT